MVKETDWPSLESKMSRISKEKQSFDRLEVSKENLRKMFGYSKYKLHYINNLVEGEHSTVYRCGSLVDLCRGPHIQNTGKIKTMRIMQVNDLPSATQLGYVMYLMCWPNRTRQRISWETNRTIRCSEYAASLSRIRN